MVTVMKQRNEQLNGPAVVHRFGKQQPESLPRPIGLKPETLNPKLPYRGNPFEEAKTSPWHLGARPEVHTKEGREGGGFKQPGLEAGVSGE